jgi:thiol:disulfide interchange protein DsbD
MNVISRSSSVPLARHRVRAVPALLAALLVLLLPLVALAADAPAPASKDAFTQAMEKGPFFAGLVAYGGGLLTAATPCVYPMIAITVAIFGAREATSRRQAVLLSGSFVLGIVCLFTPMVVGFALMGKLFGTLLSNPFVVGALILFFGACAASMFGAFEMVLPDSIMSRLSAVGGVGYGGAFVMGLVSGIVAAPCTGPVLTSILLWISQTRNLVLGSVVGATFALGLGTPFFLVGAFAVALPKGGKWMVSIKSFFGVAISVYALHMASVFPIMRNLARPDATFMAIVAGAALLGLAIGAVHLDWSDGGLGVKIRKGSGIALAVVGGALFWTAWEKPADAAPTASNSPGAATLSWEHSEAVAVAKAKSEKRPMLIDFTADWCAACKELSKHTFADPRVTEKALAANFVVVKVDATNDEDPQVEQVKGKYRVVGLPTVVIYDSNGQERKRFNEFVGPEPFLAAIEGVQ